MVQIRAEQSEEDCTAVYNVNYKAFKQDYEPGLVEALRRSNNYIPQLSLVAIDNSKIVGHILFSTISIQTDKGSIPGLALAPIAVLPGFQSQGIGVSAYYAGVSGI